MSIYRFLLTGLVLWMVASGCGNTDEELIFDKTADERVAEATTNLRQKLTAPANGWIVRYQPVPESGTYNVLLNFDADGGVRIRTDFGVNDNEFYDQTNTYRIDNSLGLELIFESYSFFSYLFEQDGATFEAEYEFVFVNETPNGELVFGSKTDPAVPTIAVLEPAPDNAEALLGRDINANLEALSSTLGVVSPVYRLNYLNRDLSLYLSLNTRLRTVSFTYATSLVGEGGRPINFTSPYLAQGSELILGNPLNGSFLGSNVSISSINFSELTDGGTVDLCGQTAPIQQYQGVVAESNDPIALLPTLFDPVGALFPDSTGTYLANPGDLYENGVSVGARMQQDIEGMIGLVLYNFGGGENPFVAVGFGIVSGEDLIVPVRDFNPTYTDNELVFNLAEDYRIVIGDTTAATDPASMNSYLDQFTQGGRTRILQLSPGVYELFNPCTGWSAILQRL